MLEKKVKNSRNPFKNHNFVSIKKIKKLVGLSDLGVLASSRSKVQGSNPAEVDRFFQDIKVLNSSPPRGTLNRGSRVGDFRLLKEFQA